MTAVTQERWAPAVPTRQQVEDADDRCEHAGLTADTIVVDTRALTRELLAWCEANGGSNLRVGNVLDALAVLAVPVEQAEPEVTGYRETDTNAFVGARRERWVGPWEES